ncbi:hypothetical protein [Paenibacillus validus]|uniref:hypothetical protein n=1 Tax=Paenibacillus validus TaxID=44253 RepID=UPI003D2D175B
MKAFKSLCLAAVLALSLTACGGGGSQDAAAKSFVQALIDGNEETLKEINKSGMLDYPTHYLISDFAPKFADRKVKDFSFEADKDKGIVTVKSSDGKLDYKLKIEKIGDKFYFTGMGR